MQTFLDTVLDALPGWDTDPQSYVFILPSKRAGFFLRNKMAEQSSGPIIAPEVQSIEEFVQDIAGLSYAPSVDLIFSLYEAYLETPGADKESFHEFTQWGQMLLQDFNEIDRHRVDSEALFETLSALNELRHWSAGDDTTPMIQRQLDFWKGLLPIYRALHRRLKEQGLGYQGMVYRQAVHRIEDHLRDHPDKRFIFIGFNALNTAESAIIRYLLEEGKAKIFWDADTHYVNDPNHDAGLFLRRYRDDWKVLGGELEGTSSHLASDKRIRMVGLPKSVSQAKYCGDLLQRLQAEGADAIDHAALVLSDESLLQPILHSLPASLEGVNVTMGHPIGQSPFAQLFRLIFEGITEASFPKWTTRRILEILSDPHMALWFQQKGVRTELVRSRLLQANALYCDRASLVESGLQASVLEVLLPTATDRLPLALTKYFLRFIESLRQVFLESDKALELAYLQRFHALFARLESLSLTHSFLSDVKGLYSLYQQLLQEEKMDFQGEPLKGLQVMGMLESRNLDFETVILTSVNEGILPSGKSQASFIPFDVKKEFGMPTYKEKDAVYTYHFYRLLQRAKRVFILYNTEPQVLEGGEPSRFIRQLKTDPLLGSSVEMEIAAPIITGMPTPPPEIPKSEALLTRLREMGEKGISPTALSSLIEDPLRFYRKNVLRIPDPVTLEETVAANTFGTVLHQALEDLYRPYLGMFLKPEMVKDMMARCGDAVTNAFRMHYVSGGRIEGKNLLALEVLKRYATRYLELERGDASRHEIEVLGLEQKLKCPFPVPGLSGQSVYLRGTVDRIERVDGQIRIIDYKTGRVVPSQLRIDALEGITSDPKHAKALQLLCYAWMYARTSQSLPLKAGILSFKNLRQGRQWFGFRTGPRQTRDSIGNEDLVDFEEQLGKLLSNLFDPSIPLVAPPLVS